MDTSGYDNADNLTSIGSNQGSTPIDSFTYGVDGNSQVTSVTSTGVPADNHTYTYNSLNQIANVDSTTTYNYDQANNPTQLTSNYQGFDTANQLCWTLPSAPTGTPTCASPPAGATTYNYDSRGNRTSVTTSASTTSLGYDQASRLTSYGTNTSYTYNGDGLRMTKTTGAVTEDYTYDQNDKILVDGATSYIYGPRGLPLEQITNSGTVTWYHHDRLGSTRPLTNSAGAVVGTFTYSPYGVLIASTGTSSTPLGYAGEYMDNESDYLYLINRYYDPATGEFLSVDPLQSTTLAKYVYVDDDPLNGADPYGLCFAGIFGHKCQGVHILKDISNVTGVISTVSGTVALIVPITAPVLGTISLASGAISTATSAVATMDDCMDNSAACGSDIAGTLMDAGDIRLRRRSSDPRGRERLHASTQLVQCRHGLEWRDRKPDPDWFDNKKFVSGAMTHRPTRTWWWMIAWIALFALASVVSARENHLWLVDGITVFITIAFASGYGLWQLRRTAGLVRTEKSCRSEPRQSGRSMVMT